MIEIASFDPKKYKTGNSLFKFRAILIGGSRTGKTSLITRFIQNHFVEHYEPTVDIV